MVLPRVNAAGIVVGRVTALDRQYHRVGLPWASILVYSSGGLVQSASPSFDGSYFIFLPPGHYLAIVEHSGYNPQGKFFDIDDERQIRLDFRMDETSVDTDGFDFSIPGISPVSVSSGRTTWTTVEVTLRSGLPEIVTLLAFGLPSGVFLSFSSSSGIPSFSRVCTITASSAAMVGFYTVTLIGLGGGIAHRTSFSLVVNVRP